MFKLLITTLMLISSIHSFAMVSGNDSKITSTPRSQRAQNRLMKNSAPMSKLFSELDAYKKAGRVNCNQNLTSAGHCMLCNCLNEVLPNASTKDYSKVSKVVFSRLKTPMRFKKRTLCGVVCDKNQFAWTIGHFDEQCRRKSRRRNSELFNTPSASSRDIKFNKCIPSIKLAAKDQLVDNPTTVFALNYLNPGASTDLSWLRSCERTLVDKSGGHLYCNPDRKNYPVVPIPGSESIAYRGPYRHDS